MIVPWQDRLYDELKEKSFEMMVVKDLVESVFGTMTTELEEFTRFALACTSAVSIMRWNRFLARQTAKKDIDNIEVSMFFGIMKELRITVMVTAV